MDQRKPLTEDGNITVERKMTDNPLLVESPKIITRVEDTALWAQDLFQLGGATGSTLMKEKNARVGSLSLCLLLCLGVAAGLLNGLILMANAALCDIQGSLIVMGGSYGIGLLYFLITMAVSVLVAALCCKYGSGDCAGSGLPQFKFILANEMTRGMYDDLLSFRVFIFKVIGLILSVGGGLSVGSEGPLVLIAACIAYLLMKHIIYFDDILDNPSLTKQILAASAAVGLGSAFNAPVGGLLFSIEVTSTFYLVSNYWKSFIAAMAGAIACNLFLITKEGANGNPLLIVEMHDFPDRQYRKWELIIYFLMGITGGYLGQVYLYLHQKVFLLMKEHNKVRPLVTAVVVSLITAFIVYLTGALTEGSVGVIAHVSDVLNSGHASEMQVFGLNPMGGLIIMLLVRIFLTLIGTNILVPAGTFMPAILIGGLMGRLIGYFVAFVGYKDAYIPGYALVGAVAFSSGITHTISVAVIAVEMTGNLGMILPCLLAAVVSSGIGKTYGLSVYDQGMLNRGLETFQLLLLGRNGNNRVAASVMDPKAASLCKTVRVLQLITALELTRQTVFPVTDDRSGTHMKLLGSVQRKDIFAFLMQLFKQNAMQDVITLVLPNDSHEHEIRLARRLKKESLKLRDSRIYNTLTNSLETTVGRITHTIEMSERYIFPSPYDYDRTFPPSTKPPTPAPTPVSTISKVEGTSDLESHGKDHSEIDTSMQNNVSRKDTPPTVNNSNDISSSSPQRDSGYKQMVTEKASPRGLIRYDADSVGSNLSSMMYRKSSVSGDGDGLPGVLGWSPSDTVEPSSTPGLFYPASVWRTANRAARSFMKDSTDRIDPPVIEPNQQGYFIDELEEKENENDEEENPRLLALFSANVHLLQEPAISINLFPLRYMIA